MNIKGKSVLFLGDSITQGSCATIVENIYHQIIKKDLNLKKAKNYGIGGTRIARAIVPSEQPIYDLDFNLRADMMIREDADYVFVFGGTNDFGHGDAPIGSKGDTTLFTFYGALKVLYKKLINTYGAEKIIVLTPLHRFNDENKRGDGSKKEDGAILSDYVEVIKEVANDNKLKVIDLFNIKELNPNIKGNEKYFADGLHPNDDGHRLLANIIEREIEKL